MGALRHGTRARGLLCVLGLLVACPTLQARHRTRSKHPAAHKKSRCHSSRYGCAGKSPTDYDKKVRVIWRPRKGYDRGCLHRLRKAGIKYRLLAHVKGVQTPVEVRSKRLGGVLYRKTWNNHRRFILACRMVEALVVMGPDIRHAGIASIYYSSTWRYTFVHNTHRLSKHASGRAIDIVAIDGAFGYASVVRHYEKGIIGCGRRNKTPRGAAFRKFICALKRRHAFRNIFTPDYNRNHRDHIHLEWPNFRLRLKPKPPTRRTTRRRKRRR